MNNEVSSFRILNAEPHGYSDEARMILKLLGDVHERPLKRAELVSELPDYDVLIVRLAHQIDRQMIDAGRRLKAIVTATTGLDHIDVEHARSCGIEVLSLHGETDFLRTVSATAEHTWALLLGLHRRIPQAVASVMAGSWDRDNFRGNELNGKRLGIVGLGRIGRKVARYGLAFDMEVAAYDPYVPDWPREVTRTSSLVDLLRRSDVLCLHAPLNQETFGMIGAGELALLPAGAILVNTSRGELIDETALVKGLERGHLGGAGLDFIIHERNQVKRRRSPLMGYARAYDNLLTTPHIGGATYESMAKTEVFMARKLMSFFNNQKMTGRSHEP